jgi:DNA-binding IclR family transcriptional regulator
MPRREKSNYAIQSVSHALDVLEQFQGEAGEIGVTELSKRLKLHKNNVFRLLATLEARGYIEQNKSTENYRLGLRCLQLGQNFLQRMGLLVQARPKLEEISRVTKESSFVAVRKGQSIIPLDFIEPQNVVRVVSLLGEALPLHCTAAGKVYLAFDSEKGVSRNLPESFERHTGKSIVDRRALADQLKEIMQAGYAVEQGEFVEDLASVAVPVYDYTRALVGSLAIAGPAYRLTHDVIQREVAPLMLKCGSDLSRRLGYQA